MIVHVVLFKPRGPVDPQTRGAILDALATAVKSCPAVRGCRVGRRVLQGLPGYEQAMAQDYQYLLLLEFDSVEGLREYLQHPAHTMLGGFFTGAADASLAYDYELVELGDAHRLA